MDDFLSQLHNNPGTSRIATLSPPQVNSLISCTAKACCNLLSRTLATSIGATNFRTMLRSNTCTVSSRTRVHIFSVHTLADALAGCAWSYFCLRLCLVRVNWLIHYRVYSCRMRCSVVCIAWSHRVMKRLSSACVTLSWLLNNCPSKPRSCKSSSVSSSCSSSRRAAILTRWKNSNW